MIKDFKNFNNTKNINESFAIEQSVQDSIEDCFLSLLDLDHFEFKLLQVGSTKSETSESLLIQSRVILGHLPVYKLSISKSSQEILHDDILQKCIKKLNSTNIFKIIKYTSTFTNMMKKNELSQSFKFECFIIHRQPIELSEPIKAIFSGLDNLGYKFVTDVEFSANMQNGFLHRNYLDLQKRDFLPDLTKDFLGRAINTKDQSFGIKLCKFIKLDLPKGGLLKTEKKEFLYQAVEKEFDALKKILQINNSGNLKTMFYKTVYNQVGTYWLNVTPDALKAATLQNLIFRSEKDWIVTFDFEHISKETSLMRIRIEPKPGYLPFEGISSSNQRYL